MHPFLKDRMWILDLYSTTAKLNRAWKSNKHWKNRKRIQKDGTVIPDTATI